MTEEDSGHDQPNDEIRLDIIEDRLVTMSALLRDYLGTVEYTSPPCHRTMYPDPENPRPEYRGIEDPLAWLDKGHC